MAASEWNFGWIDADAGATRVSGSRTSLAAPLPGGLSVANLAPPMQCKWEFSKETPTAVAPQSAMNRSTFERPAARAAPPTGNIPIAEEVPRAAETCPACAERAGEIAVTYESLIASLVIAQKRELDAIREQKRRADETVAEYDALERSLLQEQQRLVDAKPDREDALRRASEPAAQQDVFGAAGSWQQRLKALRDQKRSALQSAAMYDASERSLSKKHQRALEDLRDQKRRALHAVQQECEKTNRC